MKKFIISIAILVGLSVSAQAGWITSTSVDEMENKKTVYMKVTSEDNKGEIIIRHPEQIKDIRDTKIFWISGDSHICTGTDYEVNVKVKFDDEEVMVQETLISTDKKALFFRTVKRGRNPEYPKDWKTQQELMDEESIFFKAKDYKGALEVNAELIALLEKQKEHGIYEGVMMENGQGQVPE